MGPGPADPPSSSPTVTVPIEVARTSLDILRLTEELLARDAVKAAVRAAARRPQLAFGGDDHGGGRKHDHGAEDEESCRVRRRYDVVGELVVLSGDLRRLMAVDRERPGPELELRRA